MKLIFSFLVSVLILTSIAFSQNRESFFKVYPSSTNELPKWAQLMYSENPNVFEVDYEYYQYFRTNPFEKDIDVRNYMYWRKNVDELINPDGFINFKKERKSGHSSEKEIRSANSWTSIGPFETYNLGSDGSYPVSWQANVYCFDQCEAFPDVLFAGTEAGGVFKSIDHGLNWQLVSQDVPVTTIDDIKVSPVDSSIVYFSGEDKIFKSTDGGTSWTQKYDLGDRGYQLVIHPANPNVIHCAAHSGFFRSLDGGTTWVNLFTDKCWDVKYHPVDTNTMYLLKSNTTLNRSEFIKSTDGGISWNLKGNGWYSPSVVSQASDIGARMAVTPGSPNIIYVGLIGESKLNDNGWIGVYRSTNAGESWVNPNLPDGGPYSVPLHANMASINPDGTGFHQGFFNFSIGVSHNDPATVFLGCLSLSISMDSAATFTRIGAYNAGSNDIGWIHPDIQDIHVLGNDIWVCCDGGINYSTDELQTTESRKYGIIASDYWGFGQGWNEDVMVGGRYHNGNSGFYETYGTGNTLRLGGAEAPTGYVNPIEMRKAYFSDINTKLLPETLTGEVMSQSPLSMYPNESYYTSYSSEVEFHPYYAHHIYLGKDNKIWKSVNEGASFQLLHSFGVSGRVLEIEISRSNPDVMYCVFQPGGGYWDWCKVYKSTNGGIAWNQLSNITSNAWRLEIALNPSNENELWLCSMDGANGEKVFRTTNGGTSWQNMTTSTLNGDKPRDIQYQAGSSNVYLACTNGVYYYDSLVADWAGFSNGLPASTRALETKPFYKEGKMRMATTGRGVWERDFVSGSMPSSMPMTETDSVYCSRDTVKFDCNSILKHDGATWAWSFYPAPSFVSSLSVRYPKVVFGTDGSYDVSLTITDGAGNSSTKSLSNMVTVVNNCEPDTIPGFAMACYNSGDFAETADLGIKSNTVTITSWVRPEGIQNDYTGIVINNGTTAGFNFRANNMLGYHWPGGAWWWDSNLTIPSGEWSYVAMVATPISMTLYVNGVGATHTTNLDSVDLTTMDIGSYKAWSSRNYKGLIDEVCIWNRALTEEEIRLQRHLTKEGLVNSDPDLISYYQFNEPSGKVLDKNGIFHATMRGGAARVLSTAPIGSGSSDVQTCNAGQLYSFADEGFSVEFPATGTLPNGKVVVSHINYLPANRPNTYPNLGSYWIVNNYGNQTISPLDELVFYPQMGEISPTIVGNPAVAILHQRSDNSDESSWSQLCGATNAGIGTNSYLTYSTNCSISQTGQYFICSNDSSINLLGGTVTVVEQNNPASSTQVTLYPNPVSESNIIFINYTGNEKLRVKLYNVEGKLTKDVFINPNDEKQFNSAGLSIGMYFFLVEGESFMGSGKIMVE